MAFNIGLAGLRSASTDLEVTGNNVANASTVGFKESRAEFGDVYVTQLLGTGQKPIGAGSITENVRQLFTQGNITQTDNALDMAVDGGGFFVMEDNGVKSFTRAGYFGLDKEGFVVSNTGARLQGFEANDQGVTTGVLGDIQIIVADQPPQATTRFSSIINVDAGASVLQEQGTSITTTGFAIGTAITGLAESTSTILSASGQPTSFTAHEYNLGPLDVTTSVAAGQALFNITFGTVGPLTLNAVAGIPATVTTSDVGIENYLIALKSEVQSVIDNDAQIGPNQFAVDIQYNATIPQYELVIERDGYEGVLGTPFTLDTIVVPIGTTATTIINGTDGQDYFVGTSPINADFRSIPGTSFSTRTLNTPPFSINANVAGTPATVAATLAFGTMTFSAGSGNTISLNIALGSNTPAVLTITSATMAGVGYVSGPATLAQILDALSNELAALPAPYNTTVFTNTTAPDVNFYGSNNGEALVIASLAGTYDLTDFGFTSISVSDSGTPDQLSNAAFEINYRHEDEFGRIVTDGPFVINIPTGTYATLNALATAIQAQINVYVGANGIAGKVVADSENGLLVFRSTETGIDKEITFTAALGASTALSQLFLDNPFKSFGTDSVDKTNSFRINFTAEAPDTEGRSGSAVITLDEEYRSVQQVAQSINRQLADLDADDLIPVRAEAVEVLPQMNPPEYELQFISTDQGEASVISISDFIATGEDITVSQMLGLMNIDPSDTTLLVSGIKGVNNEYPLQSVTLVDPDGIETVIEIPEESQANEVASLLNRQPGLTASAETELYVPLSGYNNSANEMTLVLNGQSITSTSFAEIVDEINSYASTTLPGITAEIDSNGDMTIKSIIGQDIKLTIDSPNSGDSLVVRGLANTGFVTLGGSSTADKSVAVGGTVSIVLNEGYTLTNPDPSVSGIFGALTEDEFATIALNTFDPDDQNTYNHATSTTIFDSLGNPHIMTQFFVKEPLDPTRPTEQNIWAMYVLVDGRNVGDPDPDLPFPDNLEPTLARYELFFNPDGTLDEEITADVFVTNWDPLDEDGNPTGALKSKNVLEGGLPLTTPPESSNFEVVIAGSTQFGTNFSVNEVQQDGFGAGRLIGLEVDRDGIMFARYTNGQARTLAQIALANFKNPEGLIPLGDTAWAESFESGTPSIGSPRTGSFGAVRGSSLEESNVDLSEELVGLIIAQRNFQANAKTIETSDAITQTIINI